MRLEQLRIDMERKEKKKQRELERRARLKAEGKLLTAKQKQDKARAQAMLDSLRAQGIELPEVGEKRAVRPGTRVRPNKKKDALQHSQSQDDSVAVDDGKADGDESVVETVEPVVEKIKEAWDASSSEDESEEMKKDEVSVKAEPAKKPAVDSKKTPAKKIVVQESDDSDESDDDSNDEDDDDEDDDSDEESSEEEKKTDAEVKKEKAWERIMVSFIKFLNENVFFFVGLPILLDYLTNRSREFGIQRIKLSPL